MDWKITGESTQVTGHGESHSEVIIQSKTFCDFTIRIGGYYAGDHRKEALAKHIVKLLNNIGEDNENKY